MAGVNDPTPTWSARPRTFAPTSRPGAGSCARWPARLRKLVTRLKPHPEARVAPTDPLQRQCHRRRHSGLPVQQPGQRLQSAAQLRRRLRHRQLGGLQVVAQYLARMAWIQHLRDRRSSSFSGQSSPASAVGVRGGRDSTGSMAPQGPPRSPEVPHQSKSQVTGRCGLPGPSCRGRLRLGRPRARRQDRRPGPRRARRAPDPAHARRALPRAHRRRRQRNRHPGRRGAHGKHGLSATAGPATCASAKGPARPRPPRRHGHRAGNPSERWPQHQQAPMYSDQDSNSARRFSKRKLRAQAPSVLFLTACASAALHDRVRRVRAARVTSVAPGNTVAYPCPGCQRTRNGSLSIGGSGAWIIRAESPSNRANVVGNPASAERESPCTMYWTTSPRACRSRKSWTTFLI